MVLVRVLVFTLWSMLLVSARRLLRGPLHPGWSWRLEVLSRVMIWGAMRVIRARPQDVHATLRPAPLPAPVAANVTISSTELGPCNAEVVTPVDWTRDDPVILYFHGGGYAICSPGTHRDLIARIALACRARCVGVDYRLAPEHPFPAAVDDGIAAYRAMVAQGVRPERLLLGGDSAGGGLCLATMLRLRDENSPLPAGAVLISPWVDHGMTGPSIDSHAPYDYIQRAVLETFSHHYLQGADPLQPLASPLYADLHGLPPLLLHVGEVEALRWEVETFAEKARAAGVDVTVHVGEGMFHAWHAFAPMLAQSRRDIRRIGEFVRRRYGSS